jgi:hypothetical protein
MTRARQNRRPRSGPAGQAEIEVLYLIGKGIVRIGGAVGGRWKRRRLARRSRQAHASNSTAREPDIGV